MSESEQLLQLGVALAVGLLVGTERGFHSRQAREGARAAGIRTFGLLGLVGGACALLAREPGLLLGAVAVAVGGLLLAAYVLKVHRTGDLGATTEVAAFLTFVLGALAGGGELAVAAAAAVVTTVLLGLKPVLHRWVERLQPEELYAALKLLLIAVVLLPVLPDRGFGPHEAVNPYWITWTVVLISGLSFAGYIAMKVVGPERGIGVTSILGGVVSSTALTLSFARMGRDRPALQRFLAAGVVAASATMFPRVAAIAAVVNPDLLGALLVPMGAMAAAGYLPAAWLWRGRAAQPAEREAPLSNPLELGTAVKMSLLLAVLLLATRAVHAWIGEPGLYAVAALSGLADMDAITLSLADMARDGLPPEVAVRGVVLAAFVNTAVKGLLVAGIARGAMARQVATSFGLVGAAGLAAYFLA